MAKIWQEMKNNLNLFGFNPIIELISGTSKNPISGTRLHRSLLWRKPKFKSADVIDAYNDIIHGGLNNFVFWKCKKNVLLFLNDLKMSWTDWVYFKKTRCQIYKKAIHFFQRISSSNHMICFALNVYILLVFWWIEIGRSCNIMPNFRWYMKWNVKVS